MLAPYDANRPDPEAHLGWRGGPRRVRARARARVAAARAADPRRRLSGAESRRAGRPLPAGGHPPLRGPHVGARRVAGRPPVARCWRGPATGGGHPRQHLGAGSRRSSPSGSRPRSTGCGGGGWARLVGQRRGHRGDDAVAARPPQRRAEPAVAGRDRPAGQPRLRGLLQRPTPPATSPPQVWINNAWVTALCIALGILGLPRDLPAVQRTSRTSRSSARS